MDHFLAQFGGNVRRSQRVAFCSRLFLLFWACTVVTSGVAQQPQLIGLRSGAPANTRASGTAAQNPVSHVAPTVYFPIFGIDFSPYENGQDPNVNPNVSLQQIKDRMNIIAPYTMWVRSFSMTTGLENIPPVARSLGKKVAAGAWISKNLAQNQQEVNNLIAAANQGNVDIAVVGSEAVLRNDVTVTQLLAYMNQVRQGVPNNVQVTTGEVYGTLLNNPSLIAASDVVFVNIYPYWEGRSIDTAMCDFIANYNKVVAASSGKQVWISEAGWPNGGNAQNAAVPNPVNQAKFFVQFVSWARVNNVPFFWFEAFNEQWKAKYEGPQGAYWGIWDEYGVLKSWMAPPFNGQFVATTCDTTPCGTGVPSIAFSFIPPYGDKADADFLDGRECHVSTASFGVATYIQVNGGWWDKPYDNDRVTRLQSDGSWTCDITTGGIDETATQIAAFLIPNSYTPPIVHNAGTLPNELFQNSVANVFGKRSPQSVWGHIMAGNAPLTALEVDLTGAEQLMTTTAPDGKYSFANLATSGPYTATPKSTKYVFYPASQSFNNVSNATLADFTAQPVLTVQKSGNGTGLVKSGDARIDCGATCSADYAVNAPVTLTATPTGNSVFTGWLGCDLANGNHCGIKVNVPRTVVAFFKSN